MGSTTKKALAAEKAPGARKALAAGKKALAAAVAIGMLLALGGCVVEAVALPPAGVAVGGPPPPPMAEPRPPPPGGRVVWVAGYWHWTGMQYTWIPGHWEEERPGAVWRAPRYSLREGVYFYEPGGWSAPQR